MDNIMDFVTGRKKKQAEADENMQYWDKIRQMDASGQEIPPMVNPDRGTINKVLNVTPSSKSGLGKIADDLYNGLRNRFDNTFHSPIPDAQAQESSVPVPVPTEVPVPNKIDFKDYTSKTLPEGKLPNVPSQDLTDLFFKHFGAENEATPAAAVTVGENAGFNYNAVGGINENGTTDYGLMQINSGTFDGLKKRRPEEMAALGITADTPYDVLFDPEINMQVAKLVRKDEKWSGQKPFQQWYGWQDPPLGKGINLREMMNKLNNK